MRVKALYCKTLDILFPPQCLTCAAMVDRYGVLCNHCWKTVHFIADPLCSCCGYPFEYSLGENALCGKCISTPPAYTQARACFKYDDFSKSLVLALKYHDQLQLVPIYAQWLKQAGKEMLRCSTMIIPVPLHRKRFLSRRYNQAALLAEGLAKMTGKSFHAHLLQRVRATVSQTGLTRAQRTENIRGAFVVHPLAKEVIRGQKILLIDDVMTTGTTVEYCASALLKAGAAEVRVLTLARRI